MSIFWYLAMYSYIIRRVNLKIPDQVLPLSCIHVHSLQKISVRHVEYNRWEELTKLTLKPEAKIKCEYWTCSCKQKPWCRLLNPLQCSAVQVGGARSKLHAEQCGGRGSEPRSTQLFARQQIFATRCYLFFCSSEPTRLKQTSKRADGSFIIRNCRLPPENGVDVSLTLPIPPRNYCQANWLRKLALDDSESISTLHRHRSGSTGEYSVLDFCIGQT